MYTVHLDACVGAHDRALRAARALVRLLHLDRLEARRVARLRYAQHLPGAECDTHPAALAVFLVDYDLKAFGHDAPGFRLSSLRLRLVGKGSSRLGGLLERLPGVFKRRAGIPAPIHPRELLDTLLLVKLPDLDARAAPGDLLGNHIVVVGELRHLREMRNAEHLRAAR